MIFVISLGAKFSGGGIVLRKIISAVVEKSCGVKVVEPPLVKSGGLQRLIQVIWMLIWPFRFFFLSGSTILVTHSLFLISPFIFILRGKKIFFLFQGEEYRALRSPILGLLTERLLKVNFRYFKCISTNDYLAGVVKKMGGFPLQTKRCLGPKKEFFCLNRVAYSRRYIIIFARDGYNKGLCDGIRLARIISPKLPVRFIAPEDRIAAKLHEKGFECLTSTDPMEICLQMQQAVALFLPSHYEGLSLPMLEALAVGTPVVTFAEGFPRFYSQANNHVWFVENRDLASAAMKLGELAAHKAYKSRWEALIDRSFFSFEGYCDEVASLLVSNSNESKITRN